MIKNYSYLNTSEVEYLWIIKDFTDFFKYLNNGDSITSTKFDTDGNKEQRFNLKMISESEYISFTFEWPRKNWKDTIVGQISIIDKNNEKFKTIVVQIDYTKVDDEEFFPTLKIKKNDLFFRSLDLFPDNNLKVLCNLKILHNYNNISPIETPKCYQSMKHDFKELLDSQVGSDVVCEVAGKEFKLHKLVLMTRSPVFSAMFNNDMVENNSNQVKIEDISSSVFQLLMEFIYTDEITTKLDLETGIDLLKAGSKYQLEGLEALCEAQLFNLLNVKNAMDTLVIAERHNCTDLVESIKDFVKVYQREIQNIIEPEHFLEHPHHVSLFLKKKKK